MGGDGSRGEASSNLVLVGRNAPSPLGLSLRLFGAGPACVCPYRGRMPTISSSYGVKIQMFWNDHVPPHFHAIYAEDEGIIAIGTLTLIHGALPQRALALILEWATQHQEELLEDWHLCATNQTPRKIPPLP
jgi:hypothetical protein